MDYSGLEPYPEFLPLPQQQGHKQTVANKHKSVDVESGLGKLYYNPDQSKKATLNLLLTADQFLYFQIWFDQVLLNGLKWFNCPFLGQNTYVEYIPARVTPQSQIEETPTGATDVMIKMQLDVAPGEKPPVQILTYYPWSGGEDGFFEQADRLHIIVNTQMPTALSVPEL
jgi:hypothetical protein